MLKVQNTIDIYQNEEKHPFPYSSKFGDVIVIIIGFISSSLVELGFLGWKAL